MLIFRRLKYWSMIISSLIFIIFGTIIRPKDVMKYCQSNKHNSFKVKNTKLFNLLQLDFFLGVQNLFKQSYLIFLYIFIFFCIISLFFWSKKNIFGDKVLYFEIILILQIIINQTFTIIKILDFYPHSLFLLIRLE